MKNALIIIPTYNEIENIEALLRAVFLLHPQVHILVVDDNSPDQTAYKVCGLQNDFSNKLFLLKRRSKSGLGKAYIAGFKWGLEHDYKYIFEMDADFSHDPNSLIMLYKACTEQGVDIAIGSRYKNGINVVNWPLSRILLSYFASWYVRIITGMPVKDPTAGFVCYKRTALESLDLDQVKFEGYAFQIEMKYKVYHKKFKIKEIPIIFTDRVKGTSKLTKGIISEAIKGVLILRAQQILGKL
ncbi:MAG: dolichyl-phosphate beta-D-mannosyltransferase [Formosa sp.]|nr:dolichyl-phosphate beta-D-mannosyltransferase [Formosa sp.]|tara:strand:+ start:1839 stop:2564 length:726 start_codon:yes stop_codon:yes gene_type:complete